MKKINVNDIKEGMVLAKPLVNAKGSILIQKGTTLRAAFISRLIQSKVTEVYIEGEGEEKEEIAPTAQISKVQKIPLEKLFENRIVNKSMQIIYNALEKYEETSGR